MWCGHPVRLPLMRRRSIPLVSLSAVGCTSPLVWLPHGTRLAVTHGTKPPLPGASYRPAAACPASDAPLLRGGRAPALQAVTAASTAWRCPCETRLVHATAAMDSRAQRAMPGASADT